MYLTKDYFTREPIYIQGIENTSGGVETEYATEMKNRMEQYIQLYESKFLKAMLGINYVQLLEDNPELKNSIFNADSNISPAANYVYYKMWKDSIAENTMSGDKIIGSDGSVIMINVEKMVTIWNVMRDMIIDILLDTNVDVNPDFSHEIFFDINSSGI